MHRFDLTTGEHEFRHVHALETASGSCCYIGLSADSGWTYTYYVPAHKVDHFRDALRIALDNHNQHFNTPRLTVFESIGWGISQP